MEVSTQWYRITLHFGDEKDICFIKNIKSFHNKIMSLYKLLYKLLYKCFGEHLMILLYHNTNRPVTEQKRLLKEN